MHLKKLIVKGLIEKRQRVGFNKLKRTRFRIKRKNDFPFSDLRNGEREHRQSFIENHSSLRGVMISQMSKHDLVSTY